MDAFRRQMRWHVVEPYPPPFFAELAEIFGLIQELIGPSRRIARVLVNQAARIGQPDHCNAGQHKGSPHGRLPPQSPSRNWSS